MTITAIKQQIKNPDRVSIFVDGKYAFSLNLSELLEYKLKVGLELDKVELKKLTKISSDGKLKARALQWLLSRPHSQKEFTDYLKRKKVDNDLIDNWVREFSQKNYLNDAAFAAWWVEGRRLSKNSGTRKLSMELRQKGIDRQLIDNLLQDSKVEELDALKKTISKKTKLSRYKNDQQKLINYLIGQGFAYSDIKQILNK